jgi:hypothetical protein
MQAMLRQPCQAVGIIESCRRRGNHAGIAGKLTLKAQPPIQPKQCWIEGKQGEADFLEQIYPVIATAQVLALVQDDLLQFQRSKPRK